MAIRFLLGHPCWTNAMAVGSGVLQEGGGGQEEQAVGGGGGRGG